ncbi:nitroreductase family protein [Niveispirillum sp. KHB5.9]|uniref:nitroreductase family protein n=1 Tax=Niveispirillum sp. KHB5.9 TaxID=3400269 RepID=UPI003A8AD85D
MSSRQSAHPVSAQFTDRWSARSLTGEAIDDSDLLTLFEAARWAPSGFNQQPWRFVYAKRDTPHFPLFLELLAETNRAWAAKAAAIVFVLSEKRFERNGEWHDSTSHAFDTGAAAFSLSLQASLLGWNSRTVGGINRGAAKEALGVPDDYAINVAIIIGKRGTVEELPEKFRAREVLSDRLPLDRIVAEGRFVA